MKAKKQTFVRTSNSWRFSGNELDYVRGVLTSGFGSSTMGTMNQQLEEAFAKRFGMKYAITSTSGTSTLHQALIAFGVGQGDEVIVPALTVAMCGFAVFHAGAVPVFADVDPGTFLISSKDIEKKITKKTKAIMVVHLYGQVCDMDAIMRIARKHKLYVLEDCAQCFLGTDHRGRLGGTIADVGSFSFENSKHVATGEGGILVTNNTELAVRMRKFGGIGFKNIQAENARIRKDKNLFQDPKYLRHDSLGFNYRMPEVVAAVGLAQVERINYLVAQRRRIAAKYLKAIRDTKCTWLVPQKVSSGEINSYFTFGVRYEGEKEIGVSWYDFRKKFIEYGGDGIYAAWALVYNEPVMKMINTDGRCFPDGSAQLKQFQGFLNGRIACPVAESLQPKLMQFTCNQGIEKDMNVQMKALKQAISFFEKQKMKSKKT